MHQLDLNTAFLYWIPSIVVIIGMVSVLCFSFWRYHKKNEKRRKVQRDYLKMGFYHKRPRIGALRCYTHARSVELMQSFSSSAMSGMFRYNGQIESRLPRLNSLLEEEDDSFRIENRSFTDKHFPPFSWNGNATYEDALNESSFNFPSKLTKHSIEYDDYDLNREIKKNQERKRRRKKKKRAFLASNRLGLVPDSFCKESVATSSCMTRNSEPKHTTQDQSARENLAVLQTSPAWSERQSESKLGPIRSNLIQSFGVSKIEEDKQLYTELPETRPKNRGGKRELSTESHTDSHRLQVLKDSHGKSLYSPDTTALEETMVWIDTEDVAQSSI